MEGLRKMLTVHKALLSPTQYAGSPSLRYRLLTGGDIQILRAKTVSPHHWQPKKPKPVQEPPKMTFLTRQQVQDNSTQAQP